MHTGITKHVYRVIPGTNPKARTVNWNNAVWKKMYKLENKLFVPHCHKNSKPSCYG